MWDLTNNIRFALKAQNKPDEMLVLKNLWEFFLSHDVDNIAWEQNMCVTWCRQKGGMNS